MGKPLDVATLMETDMDTSPQDAALQAWKRQIDAGFRVIDVLTEGAERLREAQLEAAAGAHADAAATQKAAARAKDAAELAQLQMQWARSNAEKALAYWRAVYDNAVQTGTQLAACLAQADKEETSR